MSSGVSERMSERYKRTSERRSEWPSTLRIDFVVIVPNVRRELMYSFEADFKFLNRFFSLFLFLNYKCLKRTLAPYRANFPVILLIFFRLVS